MVKNGEPVENTVLITLRVPPSWGRPLAEWAAEHGTTRSDLLREGAKLMIQEIQKQKSQVEPQGADLAFP